MAEQGYICCYCERRLVDADSHVEHFEPQSLSPDKSLDFSNMLCSCQKENKKGEPLHCGNLKQDWYDPTLLISPFDPGCETRFSYTGNGGIKPAQSNDQAAQETIKRLGLDIPKLRALRKAAIDSFLEEGMLTRDYLRQDKDGCFAEFWTTISAIF